MKNIVLAILIACAGLSATAANAQAVLVRRTEATPPARVETPEGRDLNIVESPQDEAGTAPPWRAFVRSGGEVLFYSPQSLRRDGDRRVVEWTAIAIRNDEDEQMVMRVDIDCARMTMRPIALLYYDARAISPTRRVDYVDSAAEPIARRTTGGELARAVCG